MVKVIRLRKDAEKWIIPKKKLTIYSKWIYDDGGAEPGDEVIIETYDRETIGVGIYDGVGAVGVRVLSYEKVIPLQELIRKRILEAYEYRRRLRWNSFRLINSEGDLLPGLIIDIYKDIAVIQSGSIGFDQYLDYISDILVRHDIVEKVFVKNDQRSRREVGLEIWRDWIRGDGDTQTIIKEGDLKFKVDFLEGQKTGFFLDQRMNRFESELYSRGRVGLDLYSYTGGFGIHMLKGGASRVYFIEEDKRAIEILIDNLRLNKIYEKADIYNTSVEKFFDEDNRKYDIIISDPPALIQDRRQFKEGIDKYRWLLKNILYRTNVNGIVFYSSCSYFLKPSKFLSILEEYHHMFRLLGRLRGASIDHPYRYHDDEINYLKAVFMIVR